MRPSALRLALTSLVLFVLFAAPTRALEQTLVAADGAENDYLGWSVDVDGDTAVVGGVQDQDESPGVAYVFTRTGDSWLQTARLTGSDIQVGDRFGQSVAIDGDTIVVGAPRHIIGEVDSAGAVYTFSRTGAPNRTETAKLTIAGTPRKFSQLGYDVAIDGDVIVAGATGAGTGDTAFGEVYLFSRTGAAARTQTATLRAGDGAAFDGLGASVAIDGDVVVAGAPNEDAAGDSGPGSSRGAAYTFDATSTGIATDTGRLVPSDGLALDQFGYAVAVDGETIVATAYRDSLPGANYAGSAYTFTRTGADGRTETSKLYASDARAEDRLGWAVDVTGNTIAVGADLDDAGNNVTNEGSVYLFDRSSPMTSRTERLKQVSSSPDRANYYGSGVAMDGDAMIVSEPGDDVGTKSDAGSATIYFQPATVPACSDGGDNDGDGKIDFPADPGCTGTEDASEADPPPGATPTPTPTTDPTGGATPTPTATPSGGGPGGGTLPPDNQTGSEAPRIVRPRKQFPVEVKPRRPFVIATILKCVPEPDGSPCKGLTKVALLVELRAGVAKRIVLGGSRFTVANGKSKPFSSKLNPKGMKLLRKRGKLRVRVDMTINRAGSAPVTDTTTLVLKAAKRK